jgi:hypothetical protein
VACGRSNRCWYKQGWEEEQDEAEKDAHSLRLGGVHDASVR